MKKLLILGTGLLIASLLIGGACDLTPVAQGEPGTQGEPGEDGVGIEYIELTDAGNLIFTLTDGRVIDVGCVKGEDGISPSTGELWDEMDAWWEDKQAEEEPVGEVTAVIDTDELEFCSYPTPGQWTFPIKISNPTEDYQQITFNLTLKCISLDSMADVDDGFDMAVGAYPWGGVSIPMGITPIPGLTDCQVIYFLWTSTQTIVLSPGDETTVYARLTNFSTCLSECWEISLADVIAKEL
jgi:hypothetical protein